MQTTTATRTTTETNVNLSIRYDPTYFRTIPGIIKCVCVVSRSQASFIVQTEPYCIALFNQLQQDSVCDCFRLLLTHCHQL